MTGLAGRAFIAAVALGLAAPLLSAQRGADEHWGMVNQYCVSCHNTTDWAGKLALDAVAHDETAIAGEAETWEKVIRRMRGRLMPPPGEPRPPSTDLDAFVGFLEARIDAAAHAHVDPGYVPLHRLNRREYTNAVRDLFALEFDPTTLLPQDDLSEGFDNVAKVLQVSPTFLDQYLAAARSVAVQAVGNPAARPVGTPYTNPVGGPQHFHVEGLPFGTRGGFAVDHIFPADGEYELNINDMARALWVEGMEFENALVALVDGRKIYEVNIGGDADQKAIDQKGDAPVDAINKRLRNIRFQATAGQHRVVVTFRARTYAEDDARLASLVPGGGEDRVLKVRSFEIRGPFSTDGVSNSASRQRIFLCTPATQAEERPCAEQIAWSIARRAYRRPLTDADKAALVQTYELSRAGRTFDEGIRGVVTRILASPDFLYRPEPPPAGTAPGAPYRLDDLQLASRLSFFLWSSIPDEELLEVAAAGRLSDEAELERQVRRMLADPRALTLSRDFAFQWMGLSQACGYRAGSEHLPVRGQPPRPGGRPARGLPRGNPAVRRQRVPWQSQRDRPDERRLQFPERAAGRALRRARREGCKLPPSHAQRPGAPWAARQGCGADGELLSQPHRACAARRMDPRQRHRHAADSAAAQCRGAEGHAAWRQGALDARTDGAAQPAEELPSPATGSWIRSAWRWRTSTASAAGASGTGSRTRRSTPPASCPMARRSTDLSI